MVDLGFRRQRSERFWLPISTGCATHVTLAAALVNAICEVVERDAIALTWLQKLPLPTLDHGYFTGPVRQMVDWCSERGISTYMFDATTDIGVPTVYCVQLADTGCRAAQVVGCASDLDVAAAVERALLEAMGMRGHMHAEPLVPRRYADYDAASDGATAMGRRSGERRSASCSTISRAVPSRRRCRPNSRRIPIGSDISSRCSPTKACQYMRWIYRHASWPALIIARYEWLFRAFSRCHSGRWCNIAVTLAFTMRRCRWACGRFRRAVLTAGPSPCHEGDCECLTMAVSGFSRMARLVTPLPSISPPCPGTTSVPCR